MDVDQALEKSIYAEIDYGDYVEIRFSDDSGEHVIIASHKFIDEVNESILRDIDYENK